MREISLTTIRCLALLGMLSAAAPAAADFKSCMASVRGEAMSAGVSAATFDGATRGLEPNDAASFLDNQPEFTTPVWDYMAGLVDEDRIRDGRARLRDYASPLASAEKLYGVDPATIVAVWGVESDYGRGIGKRPLVQSLATLSCEGRRQAFFRTELFATLKIIQNGDVAASALVGSWAGAFGHTQFMPSTFLRFAVDMDGDGRRDVVGSIPDALGSTANYLRRSGWEPGQVWGFEVTVPSDYSGPTDLLGEPGRQARRRQAAGRGNSRPHPACGGWRSRLSRHRQFRCALHLQRLDFLCAGHSPPVGPTARRRTLRHPLAYRRSRPDAGGAAGVADPARPARL